MGLRENMRNEPVSALALREPVTVGPGATIREAIEQMRKKKLGCAIVVDPSRKPAGMLTESMLTQLLARDQRVLEDRVADHMAERWPHVKLSDPIEDVLEAMHLKNIRFLCVVDEQGRLAGLAGQKGLMEYVADHFPGDVMVQRIGGAPFSDKREGA
jgi:CBS domain-containing protein